MPIHLGYIKNKVVDDQSNSIFGARWTGIIKDVEIIWTMKFKILCAEWISDYENR